VYSEWTPSSQARAAARARKTAIRRTMRGESHGADMGGTPRGACGLNDPRRNLRWHP
jgi:hypothetical protein